MKELSFEKMENIEGGVRAISCASSAWGAIEYGVLLVGLAAGGPLGWVAFGTLVLGPTLIGASLVDCIVG